MIKIVCDKCGEEVPNIESLNKISLEKGSVCKFIGEFCDNCIPWMERSIKTRLPKPAEPTK